MHKSCFPQFADHDSHRQGDDDGSSNNYDHRERERERDHNHDHNKNNTSSNNSCNCWGCNADLSSVELTPCQDTGSSSKATDNWRGLGKVNVQRGGHTMKQSSLAPTQEEGRVMFSNPSGSRACYGLVAAAVAAEKGHQGPSWTCSLL